MDVWVMHGMVMDETLHVFPGGGVGELLLCGLPLAGGALLPPWGFLCVW